MNLISPLVNSFRSQCKYLSWHRCLVQVVI